MPKITALPAMSSPDAADPAPVVDDSATTTKKMTLGQVRDWLYSLVNIPTGPASPVTRDSEHFEYNHATSGLVITGDSYGVNRNASMSAGVVYINGRRISVSAVSGRTYTASRDTYVDILDNLDGTGTLVYTEVTNNNASPALAANSYRLGIVVTGASTIAAAASINQGSIDALLPIISSVPMAVCDSLGNLIACRTPNPDILCARINQAGQTTTSAAAVAVTGMTLPFIVKRAGNIMFEFSSLASSSATSNYNEVGYHDNTVATTRFCFTSSNIAQQHRHTLQYPRPMAAGSATVQLGFMAQGGGTSSLIASNTYKLVGLIRRMN